MGMPMIEHVYRRSCLVSNVDKVVLAICEEKLEEACHKLQMEYVMTDREQPTAIDRVGEAARSLGYTGHDDIVINVQGDEPAVPPPVIEFVSELLLKYPNVGCANPVERITDKTELDNPHRIKAVLSNNERLIYLTRQSIPSSEFDIDNEATFYRQTCVMSFRGDFLQKFCLMPQTNLELVEGIDMLRLIQNDYPIACSIIDDATYPVDVLDDIKTIENVFQNDKWIPKYNIINK
jgi:3-deoxy-manno-octulosonate cytidylyltransferase (CMP-KDO synthetase)